MKPVTALVASFFTQTAFGFSTTAHPASHDLIPTGYVTLKVPVEDDGIQTLSMRLDLQQSNEACGHASLNVNGLPLSQNATGQGQGALTLFDGVIISASWKFTCTRRQQNMVMEIHSVDGRIVSDVAFSTKFQQTNPVRINDVTGAARVKLIHILTSHEEYRDTDVDSDTDGNAEDAYSEVAASFKDVDAEIAALEELRFQSRHLRQLIREKEGSVVNRLVKSGDQRIQNIRPTSLKFCKDLDCIFRVLAYKLSNAEAKCRKANDWRSALTCMGENEEDIDHDALAQIIVDGQEQDYQGDEDLHSMDNDEDDWYEDDYYETSARLSMLLVIVEAILTFGFFFFCIVYFIRCRIQDRRGIYFLSDEEEQDLRRRRLTFNDFFHGLFRSDRPVLPYYDDEKGEKEAMLPKYQQMPTETIEDELISLSDAATIVAELVEVADTSAPPHPPPPPPPPASHGDAPPAYDSQSPW